MHFVFPGKGERHTDFSPIKNRSRCKIWEDFFLLLHISMKLALGRKTNISFYCHGNEEIHKKWRS